MIDLSKISGFEWDRGNSDKNVKKHGVTQREAEQLFLDPGLQVEKDIKHQEVEKRFIAIGKTADNTMLFGAFTLRRDKIRIISIRLANKRERRLYEQENTKKNS